ncbi:MAG: glutamate synthase large subunit [Acidaminococcales bacterium]|jgi:glutamate synthase (ferredoxin)|nr:glutamate synthase large subunit [Acidaminococcales bacterium]
MNSPIKRGLYDHRFEHDACGVGVVANIKGKRSNKILRQSLEVLHNMDHRGGQGADLTSGDGAGILLQVPHEFFAKECIKLDLELPPAGEYAVGFLFLPPDAVERENTQRHFERIVTANNQKVLGWRAVPVNAAVLGEKSRQSQPFIAQVFIGAGRDVLERLNIDDNALERQLYSIRRQAEKRIRYGNLRGGKYFYIASLSARTIVYKGMLTAQQLSHFYTDLQDSAIETALALVHSRFSTNTFPSWERAHPYRYLMHNGEINTLRGNINWMRARQTMCGNSLWGGKIDEIMPIIDETGSDSAMFDNCLEFLVMSGRSIPHAVMMMIPEPWSKNPHIDPDLRAFFEYHDSLIEAWDGPAAMAFTDGRVVCAALDRNGLRPSRYYITRDGTIILASEVGVIDIDPCDVIKKDRLRPGRMLLVDTIAGRVIGNDEIKRQIATEKPYQQWLDENLIKLQDIELNAELPKPDPQTLLRRQLAFGYTMEDLTKFLKPMAAKALDPVGAMGNDAPLAVLSKRPQLLYNYFKQLFAQVTNPPIDAIREEVFTDTSSGIGPEKNLIDPQPDSCRQIFAASPVLSNIELAKLKNIKQPKFEAETIPMLYPVGSGGDGLRKALCALCDAADALIAQDKCILILSDRGINKEEAAIPALLAGACLHHHLIRNGTRLKASIIIESAEPREVHHLSLLLGYGVSGINPYLAFESIENMCESGLIKGIDFEKATQNYIYACTHGIAKVLSKMGISTVQSYRGAQIFEAIGLSGQVIDEYFTGTPSRIEGIGLDEIAQEVAMRHHPAFNGAAPSLPSGSAFQWRHGGEQHIFNPRTIFTLQQACYNGDYRMFKEFSDLLSGTEFAGQTLRSLLAFSPQRLPVDIDEVEPAESICKRFKTGGMSYGSLSQEAHECLAVAMNRIGGKSNTGEGGEHPGRFKISSADMNKRSAIKQVASGRFGVTSNYLVNADELQIKIAQGAKPGEGGQLPGGKVYPWIAECRGTTAGIGLISPPPHHDIYSIEDLAQLIHDLKNSNPRARISVKLVSEIGVGTIAAGVVKAGADVVLISGYDGGTGASPRTSINHAGLPWELGLAETHQTLMLNNLRNRVILETDGKLLTGRDVVIAALLGAEEFGFGTGPLIALGCIMMRVCNLNTCPMGVATQDPALRAKFQGKPEYVINFMRFVAQEAREYMASLGFRSMDEMVGRTEVLLPKEERHWKNKNVDLSPLLYKPETEPGAARICTAKQDHHLEKSLDWRELLPICKTALATGKPISVALPIKNTDRVVGTILGSEITRLYGAQGLPEDTIDLRFKGSAGQSFGAFLPRGATLRLEGDANDHFGKGLSGGKLIIYPPAGANFKASENIIVGNVAFYGATGGCAYVSGIAGERFCIRNSGVNAVVEGIGDHGCEYMTGGAVVILGRTGRNFAAGMSGGVAYVLDKAGTFASYCNKEIVLLEPLKDAADSLLVQKMIGKHLQYTGSAAARDVLDNWSVYAAKFVKVIPKDYKLVSQVLAKYRQQGLSEQEANIKAFEEVQANG